MKKKNKKKTKKKKCSLEASLEFMLKNDLLSADIQVRKVYQMLEWLFANIYNIIFMYQIQCILSKNIFFYGKIFPVF